MEAYGAPLEQLAMALTGFVRSPEVKLLSIKTSGDLRKAVLDLVMACEHRAENRSPFYAFEQPHSAQAPAWNERSAFAEKQAAHRQELASGSSSSQSAEPEPVVPPPASLTASGHAGFAAAILHRIHDSPPGAQGVVIVLAPSSLGAPEVWLRALAPLVRDKRLDAARFIVIETDPAPTGGLATELGPVGQHIDVLVDPARKSGDIAALLDRVGGPGSVAGAQPQSVAPPHPATPPQHPPTAEGKLRGLVTAALVSAAKAMQANRAAEAVGSIRGARDLVAAAGLQREAINLELVLGGALVQAGGLGQAREAFERAIGSATEGGKHDQAATAHFALGATKLTSGDRHGALVTYAEGTVSAERSHQPALAIEGGRLTGTLASELGLEAQAIAFWSKAVKLAKAAGPQAPFTSAGESARRLAQLCRKRGLSDQATAFEAQADHFENLVVPEAPTTFAEAPLGDTPLAEEPAVVPDAASQVVAASPPAPKPSPAPVPKPVAPPPRLPPPEPAPPPVIFATPTDEGEGTDMLSVADIARLHWGVQSLATPSVVIDDLEARPPASLSDAQLETLRSATNEVLDDESTDMLTAEEIAMLRGEVAMFLPMPAQTPAPQAPAPQAPAPQAPAPRFEADDKGLNLDKMALLRDVEIEDEHDGGARVRRRDELGQRPDSSEEGE